MLSGDFKEKIKIVFISIIFFPFLLLFSPFIVFNYYRRNKFKKKYREYLQNLNGVKFFCYNNRKNSKEFIEKNVLPILHSDIKVVYLDGRIPKSDYDPKFISETLYNIKNKKGFPYLLKISNGEILDTSINNDFYNTINGNKDIDFLKKKINTFFLQEEK